MTSHLFLAFLDLGAAIAFSIIITRAQKDKQIKITLITSVPVTKVEKIVLKGKGLTVAVIGWGICILLFTYSGLSALSSLANTDASLLITFISGFLVVITMLVASHVTTHSKKS